jgi:hypothetical protein
MTMLFQSPNVRVFSVLDFKRMKKKKNNKEEEQEEDEKRRGSRSVNSTPVDPS